MGIIPPPDRGGTEKEKETRIGIREYKNGIGMRFQLGYMEENSQN